MLGPNFLHTRTHTRKRHTHTFSPTHYKLLQITPLHDAHSIPFLSLTPRTPPADYGPDICTSGPTDVPMAAVARWAEAALFTVDAA